MAMHIGNDSPPVPPVRPAAQVRPSRESDPQPAKASLRPPANDAKPDAKPQEAEAAPALPKLPEEPKEDPKSGSPASNSAMAQLTKALEKGDLAAVEQAFQALRLRRSSASLSDPFINITA